MASALMASAGLALGAWILWAMAKVATRMVRRIRLGWYTPW